MYSAKIGYDPHTTSIMCAEAIATQKEHRCNGRIVVGRFLGMKHRGEPVGEGRYVIACQCKCHATGSS